MDISDLQKRLEDAREEWTGVKRLRDDGKLRQLYSNFCAHYRL